MALSNTYKGYFYGTHNVKIPALIDIVEKIARIFIILILFKQYTFSSLDSLVSIAFLVFCVGEFISLLIFFIYYKIDIKKYKTKAKRTEDRIQLLYNILSISFPLMIAELVSASLYTASAIIIPRRLMVAGFNYNDALSLLGKVTSMAMQIVFFPMIIIFSISIILIPDISRSLSLKNDYEIEKRIRSVVIVSFLIGLAVALICLLFGDVLGQVIYNRQDLGIYIKYLAVCAPFLYASVTTRGILNGLGKQTLILKISTITSFAQVILLFILVSIPTIHIYGFMMTISI